MGFKISYAVRLAAPALGEKGEKTAMIALLSVMADSAPDVVGKPKYGLTYNSVKRLAAHTMLHVSWVRRLLRRAVAQGYVQQLGRTKYGTVVYKITAETFEELRENYEAEHNPKRLDTTTGEDSDTFDVQGAAEPDSTCAFDMDDLDGSDE